MTDKKIAIIGCGNLGLSILNGLLEKQTVPPSHIVVTRRNIDSLLHFREMGIRVTTDNIQAVNESEIIIVALKPYNIQRVIKEISPALKPDRHLVVSLATGISLEQVQQEVGTDVPAFRAMPNTAADVGMSMTCVSTNSNNAQDTEAIKACFYGFGDVIVIDEDLMNSATVLGACGVAYVLRFIRGMIQGGIQIGFDADTANKIVTNTVKGAAELLIQRNKHPESEIDKVTTPKGCTIAGLNEMEHNGFSSALIKGIVTSYKEIE